jgi:hypothetical protein
MLSPLPLLLASGIEIFGHQEPNRSQLKLRLPTALPFAVERRRFKAEDVVVSLFLGSETRGLLPYFQGKS